MSRPSSLNGNEVLSRLKIRGEGSENLILASLLRSLCHKAFLSPSKRGFWKNRFFLTLEQESKTEGREKSKSKHLGFWAGASMLCRIESKTP